MFGTLDILQGEVVDNLKEMASVSEFHCKDPKLVDYNYEIQCTNPATSIQHVGQAYLALDTRNPEVKLTPWASQDIQKHHRCLGLLCGCGWLGHQRIAGASHEESSL